MAKPYSMSSWPESFKIFLHWGLEIVILGQFIHELLQLIVNKYKYEDNYYGNEKNSNRIFV